MNNESDEIKGLIKPMQSAYENGDNAMAVARAGFNARSNSIASTLIAYDLQAGTYVDFASKNFNYIEAWGAQIAGFIDPHVENGSSLLEVGVGEATTLASVIGALGSTKLRPLGFDVSWSRIKVANAWLGENNLMANLFVGDIFHIPLDDNSIDVIYTSHSLEPNGGREKEAITELLRVARKAVIMVEPVYELASQKAKRRMDEHKYVRDLKATSESLGANVSEYKLLDVCSNQLNPSGIVLLTKNTPIESSDSGDGIRWQCPMTSVSMLDRTEYFYAKSSGIVYPVLKEIPLLRPEHGVIASLIE